ncbi:MAG: DUF695 domain-containing protein [Nocardiopsaceae bacterium]|nr:DUF695 domain-containing protein [Nocardiopsaceae bacterium]
MRRAWLRRAGTEDGDPIDKFWEWWVAAGQPAAEAGIDAGDFRSFPGEMTTRVEAIHRDLAWELAPGRRADHALIVTAAGVPDIRRRAEQWYQRSPSASTAWEYHPARQADPAALANTLEFAGHRLSLSELLFELHVEDERRVIDTAVFHPAFAKMQPDQRGQVGFLALDWALGEDGVTRWIGDLQTSITRPAAGLSVDGLIETVEALASRASESSWALLGGERDGAVAMASLALPAKWIDHPLMDQHFAVALPYVDQTSEGLPAPASLDQLRELEDKLTQLLPPHARFVAHETTQGVRTLHVYADSDDRALEELVRNAVAAWPGAKVDASLDAGWHAIRHLTG